MSHLRAHRIADGQCPECGTVPAAGYRLCSRCRGRRVRRGVAVRVPQFLSRRLAQAAPHLTVEQATVKALLDYLTLVTGRRVERRQPQKWTQADWLREAA